MKFKAEVLDATLQVFKYGFKAYHVQDRCLFPHLNVGLLDPDVKEDMVEVEARYVVVRAKLATTIPSTPAKVKMTEEPLPDATKETTIEATPDQGATKAQI